MSNSNELLERQKLLWNTISNESKSVELEMNQLDRKRTGSYFTSLELTDVMMEELVKQIVSDNKNIWELSFLEPCVGAGNFVFSYLKKAHSLGLDKQKAKQLLYNIYVCDINKDALKKYKELLSEFAEVFFNLKLDDTYFDTHIGKGLLIDVSCESISYIELADRFNQCVISDGFDIVVTNPPYKNLKAEKGQYADDEEYEKDKIKYSEISKFVKKKFSYSVDGVLNLYKIFVEEIICNYTKHGGYIDILIPASILSDKTCSKLRTHMLCNNSILSAKLIAEGSGYIDAQQALCALLLKKEKSTEVIKVTKDFCNSPSQTTQIYVEDILNDDTGNSIFALNDQEYKMLRQLRKFPIVKNLPFIVNSRGELDLTANKSAIVLDDTGYPLLRGRNINYYSIADLGSGEYVSKEFVDNSKKNMYIYNPRIICQQVVNMHKERRVTFAYIDSNYVLGNSCNFVSVLPNDFNLDIYALLGLFNTSIINWYFKLTSSNNHVNNYEIDCFPIPLHSNYIIQISNLVKEYLETKDNRLLEKIEECAYVAYGIKTVEDDNCMEEINKCARSYYNAISHVISEITLESAVSILKGNASLEAVLLQLGVVLNKFEKKVIEGITEKFIKMSKGEILNHTTFKLSDLDLEMIKSVPPGGSWKDIPMETVLKSKRLKRITETGGRTTLYGRIDYEKPSYTITTYFNRPGNGTYVHPTHERVLSVREAARFQAFKDDYYFFGNKTQHLKQVGNAVPTLLAYQIARGIREKTGCSKSIDLFCGAGGMTAGFKAAGIMSLLSNDIEESACITLKINNPEINVLCGDITKVEVKDVIEEAAKQGGADIICGGPPCQGFSMAGFRAEDDPRNQLFREFVDIVKRVNPKLIVFENVQGLLSYQGGKTYREVHTLFSELGYNTEGRTLLASDYAVPQKRKRVIIICTRHDLEISPSEIFPNSITSDEGTQVTARDTIFDLENVYCDEGARYSNSSESEILKFFKGKISYEEYIKRKTPILDEKKNVESVISDSDGQLAFDI